MHSLAVFSCIYVTIMHHDKRILLSDGIKSLDESLLKSFKFRVDCEYLEKCNLRNFVIYWIFVSSIFVAFEISTYINTPLFVSYSWQFEILNHVIQMQIFQYFMYINATKIRMKFLYDIAKTISEPSQNATKLKSSIELITNLNNLKKSLVQINEIIRTFNKTFGISLVLVLLQIYSSILINLYWLGMAALGIPYALISDAFIFIVPCLMMLLLLALQEYNFQKYRKNTIHILMKFNFQIPIVKEILVMCRQMSFSFVGLKFIGITYSEIARILGSVLGFLVILFQFKVLELKSNQKSY